jgi:hypothetical protein
LWTSGIVTGAGIFYCVGLLLLAASSGMRLTRPSEDVQLWAGLATFVVAQLVLAIVVCIHRSVLEERKVLTQLAMLFAALFTAVVSINRFVQLTIVRQAALSGETEGLARFLPYERTSAMFALEILGWGFFLGIAALVLAPVFRRGKLDASIRWTAAAYGVSSLIGTLGYAINSQLFLVGFLAWGLIFYAWTGMLFLWFGRAVREHGSWNERNLPPG